MIIPPVIFDSATLDIIREAVSEYREAPFRSADWLAGRIIDILEAADAAQAEQGSRQ